MCPLCLVPTCLQVCQPGSLALAAEGWTDRPTAPEFRAERVISGRPCCSGNAAAAPGPPQGVGGDAEAPLRLGRWGDTEGGHWPRLGGQRSARLVAEAEGWVLDWGAAGHQPVERGREDGKSRASPGGDSEAAAVGASWAEGSGGWEEERRPL